MSCEHEDYVPGCGGCFEDAVEGGRQWLESEMTGTDVSAVVFAAVPVAALLVRYEGDVVFAAVYAPDTALALVLPPGVEQEVERWVERYDGYLTAAWEAAGEMQTAAVADARRRLAHVESWRSIALQLREF